MVTQGQIAIYDVCCNQEYYISVVTALMLHSCAREIPSLLGDYQIENNETALPYCTLNVIYDDSFIFLDRNHSRYSLTPRVSSTLVRLH